MCTLIHVIWKRLWCTVNLKNDPSCFSGNTAGEIIDEEDFKFNLSGIIGKESFDVLLGIHICLLKRS